MLNLEYLLIFLSFFYPGIRNGKQAELAVYADDILAAGTHDFMKITDNSAEKYE